MSQKLGQITGSNVSHVTNLAQQYSESTNQELRRQQAVQPVMNQYNAPQNRNSVTAGRMTVQTNLMETINEEEEMLESQRQSMAVFTNQNVVQTRPSNSYMQHGSPNTGRVMQGSPNSYSQSNPAQRGSYGSMNPLQGSVGQPMSVPVQQKGLSLASSSQGNVGYGGQMPVPNSGRGLNSSSQGNVRNSNPLSGMRGQSPSSNSNPLGGMSVSQNSGQMSANPLKGLSLRSSQGR